MTQESMISDLHEALGELSDIEWRDPMTGLADVASKGWRDMSRMLNEAQVKVAQHKLPNGRLVRMRLAETIGRLIVRRIASTVVSFTGNTLTIPTLIQPNDYLRGMMVSGVNGGTGVVFIHYAGTPDDTIILSGISGTFTPGETITIIQREYKFADSATVPTLTPGSIWFAFNQGRPIEITGLVDENGNEVAITEVPQKWTNVNASEGTPTMYEKIGGGLRFETFPDDDYVYLVRAMRSPAPMASTSVDAEPEIPEVFHRCIVIYAIWWFLTRGQEYTAAYSIRKTFDDLMREAQTEYDLQDRVQRGQFKFYTEGR